VGVLKKYFSPFYPDIMKPRVLMIIPLFYPFLGGAEQQALIIAELLIKKDVPVCVLTRSIKGLPPHEVIRGIPVYRSIKTLPWKKWFGITYMLSVFCFLYCRRASYDIIHCHVLQGFHSPVAVLFKFFFNKKVIIKIAASGPLSDFRSQKKGLFGNFLFKIIKMADRIITVCSQSEEEALRVKLPASTVIKIPNGVDTNTFVPSSFVKNSKNKITFIGRLDKMKGAHILIEAFKKLKDDGSAVNLDIIGDGPEIDRLKQMTENFNINDSVIFRGEIKDVVKCLHESMIFVLPSFSEGLSNVVLEAMSCGLPVVATRAGGTTDIIEDGVNGILVEAGNVSQLSEALKQLIENKDLAEKLGIEARKTVVKNFSIEYVSDSYLSLYRQLYANDE
jgi:glycosyltransferase involved in cell wall biosynthesis